MKKQIIKVFSFLIVPAILLSSCNITKLKLPWPVGIKLSMSTEQLINKLNKISFDEESTGYHNIKTDVKEHMYEEERSMTSHHKQSLTSSVRDNNTWADVDYHFQLDDGEIDVKYRAYATQSSTYFSLEFDNNQMFGDDFQDNFRFYNGKYYIKNGWYVNLDTITSFYTAYTLITMSTGALLFKPDLYVGLLEHNFSGLTFYENETHFSLKLDVDKSDYHNESSEVIELFEDYLSPFMEDFDTFNYSSVFVFERNKCVKFGMSINFEEFPRDGSAGFLTEGTIVGDYKAKAPKTINRSAYQEISELDELQAW